MTANLFKRCNKLVSKSQFDHCIQNGKKIKIYPFLCFVLATNCSSNRIGFLVSKKWNKLAVKRNLLKRRLRESFRLLKNKNKVDVVVIPINKEAIDYQQINKLWNWLNLS